VDQLPPDQLLGSLINAHAVARSVHIVAEFGVADALTDQPASGAELARRTGLDADALSRMLRLLASAGVFTGTADAFAHTAASRLLRSDHPQSMRSFARMIGMPAVWNGFTELAHAAKTGKPARDWASLVTYFAQHTDEAALFNQAMVDKSAAVIPAVVAAYDFTPYKLIADIAGGRAHLLQGILAKVPGASGVLFEMPHVIADAAHIASSRLRLQAGDFFTDALPVADAYVMMDVIHDWDDADSTKILAAIRKVAPRHARLLIVESLVADEPGPHMGKMVDIIMLGVTGGKERSPSEYKALLGPVGFKVERVIPTASTYALLEASVI
jgi:hypothetical protein